MKLGAKVGFLLSFLLYPVLIFGQCSVGVCPSSLNFGSQLVGTSSSSQVAALMNPLNSSLSVFSFTATSGFSQTNTCSGSINPASGCQISVTFSPTSATLYSGTLTVQTSAGAFSVALSGTGTVPSTGGSWTKGSISGTIYWRGWQRPVFDTQAGQVLLYWANPNGDYGTFANAIHHYNTKTGVVTQLWSHGTHADAMEPSFLQRINNVVTWGNLAANCNTVGCMVLRVGDTIDCFEVTPDITASNTVSYDGVFKITAVAPDNSSVSWNQVGPDNPSYVPTDGYIQGPGDRSDAPSDPHTYGNFAWDSKRNVVWKLAGAAVLGGYNQANAPDAGVSDLYYFIPSTGQWTPICGVAAPALCPTWLGTSEEATAAYDPVSDTLVMYGGLRYGNPQSLLALYSPSTNTWTQGPQGPPALDYPILVSDNAGHVILYGGWNGSSFNNQTWILDLTISPPKWTRAADGPIGSQAPVADWVPRLNKMVLIDTNQTGAHVWAFDKVSWQDLGIAGGPVLSSQYPFNSGVYDPIADKFVVFIGPPTFRDSETTWELQLP